MGNYYKIMISAVARLDLIWEGGGGEHERRRRTRAARGSEGMLPGRF